MHSGFSLDPFDREEKKATRHSGRFEIGVGEIVGEAVQAVSDAPDPQP